MPPDTAAPPAPHRWRGAGQPSMWDVADQASLTPLAGRIARHPLSQGAWVDHLPGWVEGSDTVLDVLLGDIGWRADRRQMYDREVDVPRLLRWYGGGETLPHPALTDARRALDAHYARELGERAQHVGGLSRFVGGQGARHNHLQTRT